MGSKIISKLWDTEINKVITHIRVESEPIRNVLEIWNRAKSGEKFYILLDNQKLGVIAKLKDNIKYLTTSIDNVEPNKLDDLPKCDGCDFA